MTRAIGAAAGRGVFLRPLFCCKKVGSAEYRVPSTEYRVPSTQYPVPSTQYSVLCTLYSVLCTLHSVLCTFPSSKHRNSSLHRHAKNRQYAHPKRNVKQNRRPQRCDRPPASKINRCHHNQHQYERRDHSTDDHHKRRVFHEQVNNAPEGWKHPREKSDRISTMSRIVKIVDADLTKCVAVKPSPCCESCEESRKQHHKGSDQKREPRAIA